MSQPFEVQLPLEEAYSRRVLFAIELLDAVTLSRVSQGVKVVADGLQGKPIVNSSGLFVWLEEDFNNAAEGFDRSGHPAVRRTRTRAGGSRTCRQSASAHHDRTAAARGLSFAPGITGLRGTLIEEHVVPPARPGRNAEVRLRWLDDDDNWRDAPTISHTDSKAATSFRFCVSRRPKSASRERRSHRAFAGQSRRWTRAKLCRFQTSARSRHGPVDLETR